MGAGQSAEDSQQRPPVVKTSYYELLAIDREATEEEIKKAYRRKALELHPDRNYGNVEHTTALFAEVQSAYEVLSDPQERAWYDSHEDAILRDADPSRGGGQQDDGGSSNYERSAGLTTADDITRMFSRFHGGVEFSDAPSGFFGFLRETFATLAAEEERAGRMEGVEVPDYPSFGHKDDTHEDVVKIFYGVWAGFSTRKTFSWRDRYSMRGVGDRRTRRMIEKENKRFRDEGVREFNDAVRSLVAFVRKRDPRFKPNTQSEAERQKALREAAQAQAARQRAANAAKMDKEVLPEWAKARAPEELEESEEEESDEDHYECIVCRKVFKSENQFEAHERSKKHLKAVQALRRKLRKEGADLDLDDEADGTGESTPQNHGDDLDLVDGDTVDPTSKDLGGDDLTDATQDLDLNEEERKTETEGNDGNNFELQDEDDSKPDEIHPDPMSKASEAQYIHEDDEEEEEIEGDTSSDEDEKDTTPPTTPPSSQLNAKVTDEDQESTSTAPAQASAGSQPKMGKAAQKRAKRVAQTTAAAEAGQQHRCAGCNAAFPSKSRLFQHIRDFNHAAPVPASGGGAKAKGKKAKGR